MKKKELKDEEVLSIPYGECILSQDAIHTLQTFFTSSCDIKTHPIFLQLKDIPRNLDNLSKSCTDKK